MSDLDDIPTADQLDGAPHPRSTETLFGHDAAITDFLDAYNSDRLHHGWLITGPKGIGKATLAWQIAKFLLTQAPDAGMGLFGDTPAAPSTLDVSPDHPIVRRINAGSEGSLFVLKRAWDAKKKALQNVISVDEARKLKNFFSLSTTEGGHRVVIVDAADELNVSAANALLKILEEPPKKSTLLLISHQPSKLLPTIRSRCRELRLKPLSADAIDQALGQADITIDPEMRPYLPALANGSVGEAIRMAHSDGILLYHQLLSVMQDLPNLNKQKAMALADGMTGKANADKFELMITLLEIAMARLARFGATQSAPEHLAHAKEIDVFARLAPHSQAGMIWANLTQDISSRLRHGRAVNLDPSSLILDTMFKIEECAKRL